MDRDPTRPGTGGAVGEGMDMSEVWSVGASVGWLREVLRRWGQWTRGHLLATLVLSAVAFIVGWVWNTYIMAVDLEGSAVALDQETVATADGRTGSGLFWLLTFSLVGGLITYAWTRGLRNFFGDIAVLPRRFGEAVTTGRGAALAMLLWGASVSLIISTLISSAVSLALGLVLLALSASPIGVILNFVLVRLYRGLAGVIAPTSRARLAATFSPFMVMLGEALGLFADWMLGSWQIGLVVGVGCAVLSLLLARTGPVPRAAVVVALVGAAVAWQVLRVKWAYADDGGWSECSTDDGVPCSEAGLGGLFAWFGSDGATHVMARGAVGGLFATVGAAIGVGVGGAAAGAALAAAQTSATRAQAEGHSQAAGHSQATGQAHVAGQSQAAGPTESAAQAGAPAPQPRAGEAAPGLADAETGRLAGAETGHLAGADQVTQPMGFSEATFDLLSTSDLSAPDLPGQTSGAAGVGIDDVLPEAARRERDEEGDRP